MAKARQIVKRLKAVRNIRKITRTMELIATAQVKRAMDRATEAAAYTRKISEIVADLSKADLEITHPLLKPHETEQNAVLLVLSSSRGFCGGYNAGVVRQANQRIAGALAAGQTLSLEVSGKRGLGLFRFQKRKVDRSYLHFDKPAFDEVEVLANRYIEDYVAGRLDRVDVAYTKLLSASRQTAVLETLLPIGEMESPGQPLRAAAPAKAAAVDYEFLPSAAEILEEIVPAAFKARLFKCFLDAAVSEQIFRMVAMKGATENADEMIRSLSQRYNRARQAQITSELAEVIGGAVALE